MTNDITVLLLAPSAGMGGGIERYVETVEWAFSARDVPCRRANLDRPGVAGHLRMLRRLNTDWQPGDGRVRIVAAHRALLPVALAMRGRPAVVGVSVVCHGSDVWGAAVHPRWWLERQALRSRAVRVVAVSSFTAGVVRVASQATVLPPGLGRPWFETLATAAGCPRRPGGLRLVTAFRLTDWRDKGLPELMAAISTLRRPDVSLTVCGNGIAPAGLTELVRSAPWCKMRSNLVDHELAEELANADLFVLATRTRAGHRPSGEGFGLVLIEAQLAGTAVVAPAYGGSRDAYLDGVTGAAPVDETATSLAAVLRGLLEKEDQLADMGRVAAQWARLRYEPDLYATQVVARLL